MPSNGLSSEGAPPGCPCPQARHSGLGYTHLRGNTAGASSQKHPQSNAPLASPSRDQKFPEMKGLRCPHLPQVAVDPLCPPVIVAIRVGSPILHDVDWHPQRAAVADGPARGRRRPVSTGNAQAHYTCKQCHMQAANSNADLPSFVLQLTAPHPAAACAPELPSRQ